MAEIVNLRRARKAKARAAASGEAARNRVLHGRSIAERAAVTGEAERVTRLHEGHRLGQGDDS
jgi:hypothetical protein